MVTRSIPHVVTAVMLFGFEPTIAYGKWIWRSQLGFDGKEKGKNVWMI